MTGPAMRRRVEHAGRWKLKPCPHCGFDDLTVMAEESLSGAGDFFYVRCEFCCSAGPADPESPYRAVKAWNGRVAH